MKPKDRARATLLRSALRRFSKNRMPLPGLTPDGAIESLIEQMLESVHRIEYVRLIAQRSISELCRDPNHFAFDPLKAAILYMREGNHDEAWWLTFLSTHFGKHVKDGWRLTRDVYGGLGAEAPWTWNRVTADLIGFRAWWKASQTALTGANANYRFGNHRKYESLRANTNRSTPNVVESYVAWIGANRGHQLAVAHAAAEAGNNPGLLFDYLYQEMSDVTSFGRAGRFDFLTMIGKLGLAHIEPPSPYLVGATGPTTGARLLFHGRREGSPGAQELDARVIDLGRHLELGMQVMEDSLCNWQKSPTRFVPFRG